MQRLSFVITEKGGHKELSLPFTRVIAILQASGKFF